MKLVNEFDKKTVILICQILDTKPSTFFAAADFVPSKETVGPMAFILTSPKKSTSPCIQSLNDSFRKKNRGHEVNWQASKDSIYKHNSPPITEKASFPTSQVFIEGGDKRLEISNPQFERRKGESEVGLGEGCSGTTQGSRHGRGHIVIYIHRDKGGFMEVYVETRSSGKGIKNVF